MTRDELKADLDCLVRMGGFIYQDNIGKFADGPNAVIAETKAKILAEYDRLSPPPVAGDGEGE